MTFKRIAVGLLATLFLAAVAGWFSLDKETGGLLATVPTNRKLLCWKQAQKLKYPLSLKLVISSRSIQKQMNTFKGFRQGINEQ